MKEHRENTARWLLIVNLALSFYMVGEIWLTQVSCYPLWAYVGPAEYHAYHVAWWQSIWGVIFVPGALVTLCAFTMIRLRPPGVPAGAVWLGVALQVLIYGLTALWWGRLMADLESVSGPVCGPMYHRLLMTHWGRVAIVTAYGLLQLWMTAKSCLPGEPRGRSEREIRDAETGGYAAFQVRPPSAQRPAAGV